MAFEGLSSRLQNVFGKLRGKGKVSEDDVNEAMREVRLALLEADVNFKVVKDFIAKVKERAIGQECGEELYAWHGHHRYRKQRINGTNGRHATPSSLKSNKPPTVIMMAGLQGAGKTTSSASLQAAAKEKHKPLLVAGDIYRPAAIKQLQVLGEQIGVPVFTMGDQTSPVEIARSRFAASKG